VRASGRLIVNGADRRADARAAARLLEPGGPLQRPEGWHAARIEEGRLHEFDVMVGSTVHGRVRLALAGEHNRCNALAAIAAASAAGVEPGRAIEALGTFAGVRRRLEVAGEAFGVTVYDDFAHHPSAIAATLQGLRRRVDSTPAAASRVVAVFEPRSNTMRLGSMRQPLVDSLRLADRVFCYAPREGRAASRIGSPWDAARRCATKLASSGSRLLAAVPEASPGITHVTT